MKLQYLITVEKPEGVSLSEMRWYLKDAVGGWANSHVEMLTHPTDYKADFLENFVGSMFLFIVSMLVFALGFAAGGAI